MLKWSLCATGLMAALFCPRPLSAQTLGPPNQINCNKTATFSGVAVATSLVAPSAGKLIAICGWHVTTSSGTTVTFAITTGTQTTNPCDTGTVAITPALSLTSTAPSSDHIDFAVTNSALGAGLCITPSSTTESGVVYYAQY